MTEAERNQLIAQLAALDKVIASGLKQNGEGGRQVTFDDFAGLRERRDWLKSLIDGAPVSSVSKAAFRRG